MEAINHAGACVGILAKDGVVLAAEKKIHSKVWLIAAKRGPCQQAWHFCSQMTAEASMHAVASAHRWQQQHSRDCVALGRSESTPAV